MDPAYEYDNLAQVNQFNEKIYIHISLISSWILSYRYSLYYRDGIKARKKTCVILG